jgi:2-polyprenyl-3-methyl-5-hydroxy-6-metoxy-1,4-benzoquinol methylase
MEIIMGHVTNQYYEIMQKTGMASIVALTTKKNPFPQEKVNYLLITGQMKYDSSEYATLKEKIQMAGYAVILVAEAAQIQIANRLLWECRNVTADARILEVGIGSGMIAMQLAPCCKTYSGCDISKIVLDKLDGMAKERKMNNLRLYPYAADEIYHIQEKFDIILMSSVTEYFSGYNYLRKVIERCIEQIDGKGVILFADIFDLDKKDSYRQSVYQYAKAHPGVRYKRDFSHELFIPHEYWKDIANQFPQITKTFISDKIGRYKNEINRFRYDVLFEVNHSRQWQEEVPLYKYQFGMCDFLNTNERAV